MADWKQLWDLCRRIEKQTGIPVQVEGRVLDTSSFESYMEQIKEIYGGTE